MTTFSVRDRRVKPRRVKAAFGLGITEGTKIVRTWTEGAVHCELEEDESWYVREDGRLLYRLYLAAPGRMLTEDFMDAADAYGRALTVARELEFEAWVAEEKAKERAKPRPYTFEPSPSDREWWAANDNEESLGRLAPVSGGAPEPDAECGETGLWFLPGELDDREPLDLDDPEPVAVDHDADLGNGQFGMSVEGGSW